MLLQRMTAEQLRERLMAKIAPAEIDPRGALGLTDMLIALVEPCTRFILLMEERRNQGFVDGESLVEFLNVAKESCLDVKETVEQSASIFDDYLLELQGTFPEYPERPPGAAWRYEGFVSNDYVGAWIVERLLEVGVTQEALDQSMVNVNLVNVSNVFYELLAALEDLLARDTVDNPGLYEGLLSLRMRLDDVVQGYFNGIPIEGGGTFPGLLFGIDRMFELLNVQLDTPADHHYLA